MKPLLLLIATIAALNISVAADYTEAKDDFSNGISRTLRFDDVGNAASLFVTCTDEKKAFWVQIAIDDVIFPDDASGSTMQLKMTHKFDTAEAAISSVWIMPMMKYHNAQFAGDESQFMSEAIAANRLAVKQDTSGAAYRFEIDDEAREKLSLIATSCNLL